MQSTSPTTLARPRTALLQELRSLLDAAHAARLEGDHLRGVDAARRALALAEETGQRTSEARALASLALHEMRLGETEDAVAHGLRALPLLRKRREAGERAEVLCIIVLAYVDMGLATDGLAYASLAIDAARASGSPSHMSWALNRAALAHLALGDTARGEPLLDEALRVAREIDDREAIFSALTNTCDHLIGVARTQAGDEKTRTLVRALACGDEAVELARESGSPHRQAVCESNLAAANVELGRYDEALRHLAQEEQLSAGRGWRGIHVGALSNRAALERHRGNLEASIEFHRQALAEAHSTDDQQLLVEIHRGLYQSHKQRGEFEQALVHHESLHALEGEQLAQRANRQARLLLNRVELEHVQSAVERARLDADMQRLRASVLETENAQLAVRADELGRSALEDQLTGLANRRRVDNDLPELLAAVHRQGEPLCVALADLDHFKHVNDRHGHAVGDDVLRGCARLFMENTRATDLVARLGGEEFLVVLVGTPLEAAQEICERLRVAVAGHDWTGIADKLHVTVSIGLCDAWTSPDTRDLLARADAVLYAAKRGGRNRVVAQWTDAPPRPPAH